MGAENAIRASRAVGFDVRPDALVTVTSRFQRMAWKYRAVAYATTLRHAGVLYQTMYLVATAIGLAPCGLGNGDADMSARVLGLDYLKESSVGRFPARHPWPGRRDRRRPRRGMAHGEQPGMVASRRRVICPVINVSEPSETLVDGRPGNMDIAAGRKGKKSRTATHSQDCRFGVDFMDTPESVEGNA
ncbi:MAG: dehydrogenase [Amycolatopsis sp.]|uniref:nitroreductase family protein n=1 Tax=Amycolatopsis sp. TaxID=37632 RepID=UPI002604B492|nr:nitroreductase family protein [Amycolatopsis sp.]MCU1681131.1 dehydrogenase [Amycolatopsis sp.]